MIADLGHPEQELQSLEPFFCASFSSCHRSIVNSSVSLWNRLFENIEHLDYPEQLKAALVQMQLHADIILPGLEAGSSEHPGQQPSFIESFDDFSLPRYPSTRSSSRRGTPRPASSQSKSPTSLKLAVPDKKQRGRSPLQRPVTANRSSRTPRLRHDDSQVQFAAIEPSPGLDSPGESQVLTERQKEVRERQRENPALFPEIQSSPRPKSSDADVPMQTRPSPLLVNTRPRQATTPEPEGVFNDYVSSTPTPRRGQAMVMLDHDMTDPPSSPPEPRGNPLAAEIKSKSASHTLLEEWHFSSSPISGSPNPNRHGLIADPSSQRGYVSIVSLPDVPRLPSNDVRRGNEAELPSATDDVIEDSFSIVNRMDIAPALDTSSFPVEEGPSTPQRSPRLSSPLVQETATPKSDREVFVDAPTSPLPPTPKRSDRAAKADRSPKPAPARVTVADNTSFEISDVDERSLLRLVVELDSGKVDPLEYHRSSASPEGKGQTSEATRDCIVVGDSPRKPEQRVVPRKTRASSVPYEISSSYESLRPKNLSRSFKPLIRRKRKRTSSKPHESSGQKRRRKDAVSATGELPDSKTALVQVSGQAPTVGSADGKNLESPEERIPSSSVDFSSQDSPSPGVLVHSQDSAAPVSGEVMEVEGDDREVQCQIARESFRHSQRQVEEDGGQAVASEHGPSREEPIQVDAHQPVVDEEKDVKAAELLIEAKETHEDEPTQLQKIMDLFRGGLDELRTARLSRHEVYQIEDMFMDMKRELYEAERRGRT